MHPIAITIVAFLCGAGLTGLLFYTCCRASGKCSCREEQEELRKKWPGVKRTPEEWQQRYRAIAEHIRVKGHKSACVKYRLTMSAAEWINAHYGNTHEDPDNQTHKSKEGL